MNVYAKLQKARVTLQNMNIQKSGENKFAGYDYFELADFMPPINELFLELGLFGKVSYTKELATLTVINTDKPEETIEFTSPMAEANLKGCHDIQNMGAVETYQRRYLYTTALEIVEKDMLDATTGKDKQQPQQTRQQAPQQPQQQRQGNTGGQQSASAEQATEPQVKMLRAKMRDAKMELNHVNAFLGLQLESITELPRSRVNDLIKYLDANKVTA